jgi:hypothetical protein
MKWVSLHNLKERQLWRGTRIRFPAGDPYEDVVEFMFYLCPTSPSGFGLVVTSGYKAGHVNGYLPAEAKPSGDVIAISTSWLKSNFRKQIWNVSPRKVFVSAGKPPAPRLPNSKT